MALIPIEINKNHSRKMECEFPAVIITCMRQGLTEKNIWQKQAVSIAKELTVQREVIRDEAGKKMNPVNHESRMPEEEFGFAW